MSFIADIDGRVVGADLAGHDGRCGFINHLAVHPDFRWKGIGRELVNYYLRVLVDAGIRKCHMLTFNKNANRIRFWESPGWKPRFDIGVISKDINK